MDNETSTPCKIKLNCSANKGDVKNIIGKTVAIIVFLFFSPKK